MKKAVFFLATVFLMAGCQEPEEEEIGRPFDKVKGLSGTWQITNAKLIDEQSILKEETDLNAFYTNNPSSLMTITFTEADSAFSVTPGEGKNFFGTEGTWKYDDPKFPQFIYLYSQATDTSGQTITDTITLEMGSTVNEFSSMVNLRYPRYCDGENVTSYEFQFMRQ